MILVRTGPMDGRWWYLSPASILQRPRRLKPRGVLLRHPPQMSWERSDEFINYPVVRPSITLSSIDTIFPVLKYFCIQGPSPEMFMPEGRPD